MRTNVSVFLVIFYCRWTVALQIVAPGTGATAKIIQPGRREGR